MRILKLPAIMSLFYYSYLLWVVDALWIKKKRENFTVLRKQIKQVE